MTIQNSEMSVDPWHLPKSPEREIVTIVVPAQRYEITFQVLDGERLDVTYGNTTHRYDLMTNKPAGWTKTGDQPLTSPPKFRAARLGPDELADIKAEVRRITGSDE